MNAASGVYIYIYRFFFLYFFFSHPPRLLYFFSLLPSPRALRRTYITSYSIRLGGATIWFSALHPSLRPRRAKNPRRFYSFFFFHTHHENKNGEKSDAKTRRKIQTRASKNVWNAFGVGVVTQYYIRRNNELPFAYSSYTWNVCFVCVRKRVFYTHAQKNIRLL